MRIPINLGRLNASAFPFICLLVSSTLNRVEPNEEEDTRQSPGKVCTFPDDERLTDLPERRSGGIVSLHCVAVPSIGSLHIISYRPLRGQRFLVLAAWLHRGSDPGGAC